MTTWVIGGGLAGTATALEIAGGGGDVVVLREGPGATALCWGSIDVAAASPMRSGLPWRDPVAGDPLSPAERLTFLLRSGASHPFGVLFPGVDDETVARALSSVNAAIRSLKGWLGAAGLGLEGELDRNRLLANVRGAVRVVDLALSPAAEGDLVGAETVVFADIPGLPDYQARPAARMLAAELAGLGLPIPRIRVERPALSDTLLDAAFSPARLAALLDTDAGRNDFVRGAASLAGKKRLLLFPPILGLDGSAILHDALREATGARIGELLGAPPWSPAGLRLDRALVRALDRAGVRLRSGRATELARQGDRIEAVRFTDAAGSQECEAGVVVLATGRFAGGGLVEKDGRVCERLLALPLHDDRGRRIDGTPARRHVRGGYADPQPLFSAGIRTDAGLRPLERDGRPRLTNLLAAGELIGGFDPAIMRTGLGFALVSGLRAGAAALALSKGLDS